MQVALHPHEERHLTVQGYVRELGRATAADPSYVAPPCRCIACRQTVPLRPKVATPGLTQHFTHERNSGFCPTKTPAGAPYLGLRPNEPDEAAAAALKVAFRGNWRRHYAKVADLLPLMAVTEFISMLEAMNEAN